jgi:hypothetical protein
MPPAKLATYLCRNCRTVATMPAIAGPGFRLVCLMCHSYMWRAWTDPITTPEQRELAARGLVWNPGSSPEVQTK